MVKSMTGYGAAAGEHRGAEITVEMKSVNNRYFDFSLKIPRTYISLEEQLKPILQKRISRGKVDMFVTLDLSRAQIDELRVNMQLARSYVAAVRAVTEEFMLADKLSAVDILRFPDILKVERDDSDKEGLCAEIIRIASNAIDAFDEMRIREGARLRDDIVARLDEILRLVIEVERRSPETVEDYRRRLTSRMEEVLQSRQIDEQRILMEAAIFADKTAINEETVRLRSHIKELRSMLELGDPIGRKLDFLVQELNREANTIASKGNDSEVSRIAIDLKAEIEKIREQAQNIE